MLLTYTGLPTPSTPRPDGPPPWPLRVRKYSLQTLQNLASSGSHPNPPVRALLLLEDSPHGTVQSPTSKQTFGILSMCAHQGLPVR